jgi:LysM repeat protein
MKPKDKPVSKISTTQTNTNQKNYNKDNESMNSNSSLLKKNEFTLIIAGALVATVIVFFVFFKSSGPENKEVGLMSSTGGSSNLMELEKRMGAIEAMSGKISTQDPGALGFSPGTPAEMAPLQQKVQRLETSVSVKFDSLIERMGKLEKQVRVLSLKPRTSPAKIKSTAPKKSSQKTASMFHTVKKGETLWSISQKYKTSVATLRKLNKMSPTATIYPGTNLLIR